MSQLNCMVCGQELRRDETGQIEKHKCEWPTIVGFSVTMDAASIDPDRAR